MTDGPDTWLQLVTALTAMVLVGVVLLIAAIIAAVLG